MKAMIQHESERLGVARGVDDVPSFEMETRESFPQLCMPRSPPEGVFTLFYATASGITLFQMWTSIRGGLASAGWRLYFESTGCADDVLLNRP